MMLDARSYRFSQRDQAAGALRRLVAEAPGLPAQALALVILLYLATAEGGYYARDWYPVALVIVILTGIWAGVVATPAPRRAAVVATAAFAAFAAWALISITWADQAGIAWDAANRAVLYAAVFALFALWPVPPRAARWLIVLLGIGVALIGLVELLRWAASGDPESFLLGGRLSQPVGYQNGDVALWLSGAFACVWLAADRQAVTLLRGLALGAVPLLASLAWLGQSRGSMFALPLAVLVFLAVTPGRLRLLAVMVPAAAAVAVAVGPTLDVVDASSASALPRLVDTAARAILIPAAAVAVLGFLVALLERRSTPSPAVNARIARVSTAVVATVVLVGLAAAVVNQGELRSELSTRWHQFKSNEAEGTGSARLSSAGTNRYDFWRVAWENFEREPLRGVGMDNFQQDYALRGESLEKPRFPHSFELALLSETGLVGALLMLAGTVAALVAAFGARRALAARAARGPAMVALTVFAYLLLHTSVDWFYELPALGALTFAMLGLAAGAAEAPPEPGRAASRRAAALGTSARVIGVVLAVATAVSFALPWLAERQIDGALDTWRAAPDDAFEQLDRAASLNPLSVRPELVEGGIAGELGRLSRAERAYREVVRTEPRNSYAWLQLAVIASSREEHRLARQNLRRARALAPRDGATKELGDRIEEGAKISPDQARRVILKYARGGSE